MKQIKTFTFLLSSLLLIGCVSSVSNSSFNSDSQPSSSLTSNNTSISSENLPQFLITFISNAEVSIEPILTSYLTLPPHVNNDPYVLEAWYYERDFTNVVIFPLTVTENITIYAHWVTSSSGLNYRLNSNNDGYIVESYAGNAYQVAIPNFYEGLAIKELGDYVFYENGSLISVSLPNSLTKIGFAAFKNATSIETISLPSSLQIIAGDAFSGASNLKNINLDATSLTTIASNAFEGTTLSSITLPNSITELDSRSFANISTLTSVTILATTPPLVFPSSFDSTNSNLKIYVPQTALSSYQTSSYWSPYINKLHSI